MYRIFLNITLSIPVILTILLNTLLPGLGS